MGGQFETLMQVAGLVALLLYLLASLRTFPQRAGRWLQRAALLTLGFAILLAIIETIRWFAGTL
ncbi:MAG TPA: hypothetical protein PKA55_20390 [Rhodoblastus sp.]|nr:hypothetical protein [Rhodoblastus sp.]